MCTSSDIFLTRTPWLYWETRKTLISSYESVLRIAICMPLVWAYFCLWIDLMDVIGMALWVSLSWTDGCRWYCPFKWKIKDTTQFPNPKEIYMYAICMDLRMPLGWTYMYVGRHELWMPLSSAYDCWWRGYIDAVGMTLWVFLACDHSRHVPMISQLVYTYYFEIDMWLRMI